MRQYSIRCKGHNPSMELEGPLIPQGWFTLWWTRPPVMNSREIIKFDCREQHSCPVVVYTTGKSPLVENIVHCWKNDMDANVADTY